MNLLSPFIGSKTIWYLGFEPNLYITTTFSSLEYTNKIVYKSSLFLIYFGGLDALRPFSLLYPWWERADYINLSFIILSLSILEYTKQYLYESSTFFLILNKNILILRLLSMSFWHLDYSYLGFQPINTQRIILPKVYWNLVLVITIVV